MMSGVHSTFGGSTGSIGHVAKGNEGIVIGQGARSQHVLGEEPVRSATFRIRMRSSGNVKGSAAAARRLQNARQVAAQAMASH